MVDGAKGDLILGHLAIDVEETDDVGIYISNPRNDAPEIANLTPKQARAFAASLLIAADAAENGFDFIAKVNVTIMVLP